MYGLNRSQESYMKIAQFIDYSNLTVAYQPVARGVQTGAIAPPPQWMQGPLGRL